MTAPLRYLSVCSGIEAATLAWHPLGWQAAGYAEIDPFASRVLHHHYMSGRPRVMPDPDEAGIAPKERRVRRAAVKAVSRLPERANGVPNFGDFTAIDLRDVGPVDLLVGGTPCQAFSVAGKRLSLDDARGNLSLAYTVLAHELVRSHGLRWAVWENVPGVLSTPDNAFGCFLAGLVGADDPVPLPRGAKRWPDAGLAAGPRARAAWRILDTQYFGLAQRRRRVFVVTGFVDGADPAAVLLERHGLHRDPPAREQAREDLARPLAAGSPGSGGYRNDADTADSLIAGTLSAARGSSCANAADLETYLPVAFGGNNTAGPIDVATAVNAHGGPHGRQDFESETFVTHALRGEGFDASEDGSGRGTPLVPLCFDPRQADVLIHGDRTGPLDTKFPGPAIVFDTTQITHPQNRSDPQPGDPCHPLAAEAHAPTIAFQARGSNLDVGQNVTGTLSLNCGSASGGAPCVATSWAVRRLMPVETERLQGLPDDYTAIPGAADGPRYRTHGNSMPVAVMAWIGRRIEAAERANGARP